MNRQAWVISADVHAMGQRLLRSRLRYNRNRLNKPGGNLS